MWWLSGNKRTAVASGRRQEIVEFAIENRELLESACINLSKESTESSGVFSVNGIFVSFYFMLHHLGCDSNKISEFFSKLYQGYGQRTGKETEAPLALRNYLTGNVGSHIIKGSHSEDSMRILLTTAWNNFIIGKKVTLIKIFDPNEYPEIIVG